MKLFHILLTAILVVTACTPQSAVVGNNTSANFTNQAQVAGGHLSPVVGSNTRVQTQSKAVVKPYTGKIELKFDTALLKDYKGAHKVIPWSSVREGGFVTQAVPAGPVVFQETFVRTHTGLTNQGQDRVQRSFTVADPSKFYTVHVQNGDAQGNNGTNSAVINLNGFDWIRANEIKSHIPELQKDSVLLQANNTLTVTHHGAPGSTFTLTVVEGGQAGTIRRRNGPMNDHPIQADHVKGHDKNIFDPSDPNSLGDLLPAGPGNKNVPVPETSSVSMVINNQPPSETITGQAIVKIAEPVAQNLQTIQTLYNAAILSGPDDAGFYLIQADMTKIDLANLSDNLRLMNAQEADPFFVVKEGIFGNLESAKTFCFVTDLIAKGLVSGIGLNKVLEEDAIPVKTKEDPFQPISDFLKKYFGDLASTAWWLNDNSTQVTRAWNYSTGFNPNTFPPKRIRVAVISIGFAGLFKLIQPGQDLHGQILFAENGRSLSKRIATSSNGSFTITNYGESGWDESFLANEDILDVPNFNYKLHPSQGGHGTVSASIIVSKTNDGNGIAGVAPQAVVIPFRLSSPGPNYWEIKEAIKLAREANVDVINMSLGGSNAPDYLGDLLARRKFNVFFDWHVSMQEQVRLASEQNIVIVASAGNGSWNIKNGTYAGRKDDSGQLIFPEIIPVGAIHDLSPEVANAPNDLVRAMYDTSDLGTIEPPQKHDLQKWHGSNWGDGMVWAPGVFRAGLELSNANGEVKAVHVFGSSTATPTIAGIVALLKAHHPELTNKRSSNNRIVDFLRQTALTRFNYSDGRLRDFPMYIPEYETLGKFCIDLGTPIFPGTCGKILNPQPAIELKIANALRAVEALNIQPVEQIKGTLIQGVSNDVFLQTTTGSLQLSWAGNTSRTFIEQFYTENKNPLAPIPDFMRISTLLNDPNNFVEVNGWRRGNTLYMTHVKLVIPPPASPDDLISSNVTTNRFTLSWSPVSGATSYRILRGSTEIANALGDTSIDVTGLTTSTTYLMKVIAVNDSGVSLASTLSVTTAGGGSCANPIVDAVVTNSTWNYMDGANPLNAKELTFSEFPRIINISNPGAEVTGTKNGSIVKPIWAQQQCTICSFVFFFNYNFPSGSTVQEAFVEIQADDSAEVSANSRTVGTADFDETFGANAPKKMTVPSNAIQPGSNQIKFSLLGFNGQFGAGAVAAKFTVKRCPQ